MTASDGRDRLQEEGFCGAAATPERRRTLRAVSIITTSTPMSLIPRRRVDAVLLGLVTGISHSKHFLFIDVAARRRLSRPPFTIFSCHRSARALIRLFDAILALPGDEAELDDDKMNSRHTRRLLQHYASGVAGLDIFAVSARG